ncbi:response regulator transcription factor [Candidatus Saccharibacteria bacterium]|nr:response regulator transcription factor [Candidatus Saccharibacteria bacterium]
MDPQQNSKKIIIVEDNASLAEIYKTRLELLGYTCFVAYNGITGLYFIQKEIPDLVLLDLMIPDISGGQVLATMRGSDWGKTIPVYVISNLNETEAPKDLRDLGISGYSVKAMMTEDTVDKIVNSILRPDVQPAPPEMGVIPTGQPTLADIPVHEAPPETPAA